MYTNVYKKKYFHLHIKTKILNNLLYKSKRCIHFFKFSTNFRNISYVLFRNSVFVRAHSAFMREASAIIIAASANFSSAAIRLVSSSTTHESFTFVWSSKTTQHYVTLLILDFSHIYQKKSKNQFQSSTLVHLL